MANRTEEKAEEILTEDVLFEGLGRIVPEDENYVEQKLARNIYVAINKNNALLNKNDKNLLDERIIQSINSSKRNKIFAWSGIAASLFLIIGIVTVFQQEKIPDIISFAEQMEISQDESTHLILSEDKNIKINTIESKIEYSQTGDQIEIDANGQHKQQVNSISSLVNSVIVPYGKRTQIRLSDNSTVWLNSGSKLVYPAVFQKNNREVYLEGEAIFDVHHNPDRPFFVRTKNLEIKVLGTVFNVSAYNDDQTTNTILESGSIEVKYRSNALFGQSKEKMIPGMMAVYDPAKKTLTQNDVDAKNYISWKDGYVVIERKTLGYITKKLSRYYNVPIKIDNMNLEVQSFSGYLDLRNSANQVLEMINEMVEFEITQLEGQIIIK